MSEREKKLFQIRVPIGSVLQWGDCMKTPTESPTFIEVEVEAYTVKAAMDRLSRALTRLCEETP